MIKKWHKAILLEEIDFDKIPSSIVREVEELTNERNVLAYEKLFVEMGYDFDDIINELEQVDEEYRKNYIYQLFKDTLPTKQELKNVEREMGNFELWNFISSTFNEDHIPREYTKELNKQFRKETLESWKYEKISRLTELREKLLPERQLRKEELIEKCTSKTATKEEEKELEYIEEYDQHQVELVNTPELTVDEEKFDHLEINDLDVDFGMDNDIEMSSVDIDGDFGDFNQGSDEEFYLNEEQIKAKEEKETVEVQNNSEEQHEKDSEDSKTEIEKEVETIEVIKEVTDPNLTRIIEEQEKQIEEIIVKSNKTLNQEQERFQKQIEELQEAIEKTKESYERISEKEKEEFDHEISKKEEEIGILRDWISESKAEAERELERKKAIDKALAFEELNATSKKELRKLCDKLTITYTKKDKKYQLVSKLMVKADRLLRRYNDIDLEDEIEKRMKMGEGQLLTKEFSIDPFANLNANTTPDMFSVEGDPFANFDQGANSEDLFGNEQDPFGNIDMGDSMDMFGGGNDPFANFDPGESADNMFGNQDDPFKNMTNDSGMEDEFATQDDPFKNIDKNSGMDNEFSSGTDPFKVNDLNTAEVDDILGLESSEDNRFNNMTDETIDLTNDSDSKEETKKGKWFNKKK